MNLEAFVKSVHESLLAGEKHSTAGLGTFSTCTRKAAPGRPRCRMAMFRADAALRARVAGEGGSSDVEAIVAPLVGDGAVEIPDVGRIEVVHQRGKTQVVFRGAESLNDALTATLLADDSK